MTKLYGFTFMRGVDKLDYPYLEMLESMSGLTDKIYLALGDSDDKTGENVRKLPNVDVIDTTWEDKYSGDGGTIFSRQANIALDKLRAEHGDEDDAWALFLHCDEIIHPDQYQELKDKIEEAKANGHDAVRVRFIHFWKDHYHMAINKRWQPMEIRAFKLKSNIVCHGDAQGFSGFNSQIDSDVLLLHYGHVRPAEQHKAKQEEIMRRIRPAEKFDKYWKREKKAFAKTKLAPVLIKHPEFMRSRIERLGDMFDLPEAGRICIFGNRLDFQKSTLDRINAKEIIWNKKVPGALFMHMNPGLIDRILYNEPKSVNMESHLATDWSKDMQLILRLSRLGVSQK
ncbi:glycosyltransferase family 2 protein [Bacteriovorax sp. Seq25_V]|uniref:glycosyltransferase family 2 protein n=1 Tax=Bacteriovorax sp. Seq25_V TaxID=1201288 RepID=UPI00038A2238|nr:glycosyltransferase family 2 protein [Bacteriovorax sp. Seq25_V]EQC43374.1 hypothetical protein M900_0079 [Bacteriovorax sp. Seq25_V]